MEISTEKTKLMTNNTSSINKIKVDSQKLETVAGLKYICLVVSDEGSKPEMFSRIAQITTAVTRWKPVWNDRSISLGSYIQMMHFLVTSIFLYVYESWTFTAELQRRILAMEVRCYRNV